MFNRYQITVTAEYFGYICMYFLRYVIIKNKNKTVMFQAKP